MCLSPLFQPPNKQWRKGRAFPLSFPVPCFWTPKAFDISGGYPLYVSDGWNESGECLKIQVACEANLRSVENRAKTRISAEMIRGYPNLPPPRTFPHPCFRPSWKSAPQAKICWGKIHLEHFMVRNLPPPCFRPSWKYRISPEFKYIAPLSPVFSRFDHSVIEGEGKGANLRWLPTTLQYKIPQNYPENEKHLLWYIQTVPSPQNLELNMFLSSSGRNLRKVNNADKFCTDKLSSFLVRVQWWLYAAIW